MNRFYNFRLGDDSRGLYSTPKELHELLESIYPQKYNFIGCDTINELIVFAEAFSVDNEFTCTEQKAYLTLVMFLFGSQFEQDASRGHMILDVMTSYFKSNNFNNHLLLFHNTHALRLIKNHD